MIDLLFSPGGRINRSRLWLAVLLHVAAMLALGMSLAVLWRIVPGSVDADGMFSVEGAAAIPYLVLVFGYVGAAFWSGICIGIKRFHDRGKPGAWVLIQLVPVIGSLWYFIEVGCLAGTAGPNRYGPDPLAAAAPGALPA